MKVFFFFRPDGVGLQLDIPDERLLYMLLNADVTRVSENKVITKKEGIEGDVVDWIDEILYKYTMDDQDGIVYLMNILLKNSLVEFPCKNDGEIMEKEVPPIETETTSGDQFGAMCANNEEEQTNLLVETVESTNDQKISAAVSERFHMCPEDLKSARSDLTEEEFR